MKMLWNLYQLSSRDSALNATSEVKSSVLLIASKYVSNVVNLILFSSATEISSETIQVLSLYSAILWHNTFRVDITASGHLVIPCSSSSRPANGI